MVSMYKGIKMLNFFKKSQFLNYIFPAYQPMNVVGLHGNIQSETEVTEYDLEAASLFDSDEMQIDRIYQCL